MLSTLQGECSTEINTSYAAFTSEATVGAISNTDLLANDDEPFNPETFKDYIDLIKDYIVNQADSIRAALESTRDDSATNLDTALNTILTDNADEIGDNEEKNLKKLLKVATKTVDIQIDSCVAFWETLGEVFITIVEGIWAECAKNSNCPPPASD